MSEPEQPSDNTSVDADDPGASHIVSVVEALDAIAQRNAYVLLLQVLLGFIAYQVMLSGPLFFDDQQFILWNEHVTQFDVGEIYRSSVTEGVGLQSNTYRPNQQLVFAVLYKFFGSSPIPYHLVSLTVHLANTFLVFLLLVALSLGRTGSLLGSLLFLLHPVQTQAVSYASGLAGPLLLLSLLGAILCWIKSLESHDTGRRATWLAVAFALCVDAAFTKSNVVVIAPITFVLASYFVLTGRQRVSSYLVGSVAGFALFSVVFLVLKLTVLNFAGTTGMVEGYNVYTESLLVRLMTFVSVLDRYLELIVWPAALSYSKPKFIYASILTLHGVLGMMIVAAAVFVVARAKSWPTAFLGCGWFFAALAPFSGVIPLTSMYLEHWLYIPLVGVAILVARAYAAVDRELRSNFATVAVAILLVLLVRTGVRNYDWADPERFYLADMRVAGMSTQMLNNLAVHLMEQSEYDRAIQVLEAVVKASDTTPEPHNNLARIYLERGEPHVAKQHYLRALEIDPANRDALLGLRGLYDSLGQTSEAMKIEQRIRALEREENLSVE